MVKKISAQTLADAAADKRLQVLRLVAHSGSISQAARDAGISYKAAWQALHTLSGLAGQPVVLGSVGGAGGGGARLTEAGQRLLHAAGLMAQARRAVLAQVNAPQAARAAPADAAEGLAQDLAVINAPRTSMRNVLRCTVLALHSASARDPLVVVQMALPGGAGLASRMTRESAELLGLSPGTSVLALCKATAVHVAPADAPPQTRPAHGTMLQARVERVLRGAEQDEVTLLIDHMPLTGFARHPHRLRKGSRAVAWLDDSAVVVALA